MATGRLRLDRLAATPDEVGRLMSAKFGIKSMSTDFGAYRAAEVRITAAFGKALAADGKSGL